MSHVVIYPSEEPLGWSSYDGSYHNSSSYGKPYHSNDVVLHVSMCCEKCVQKVRKALKSVDDVESVDIDMHRQSVIVRGHVNPERVLRKVRKVKQTATFWDSSHDYAGYSTGAYDYHRPASSSYDYNYYSRTPTYDYSYSYPSSYDYSRPNDYHHHSSYDAYRYR